MRTDRRGVGLVSTLVTFTAIVAFLAGVGLALSQERSRVRDAHRIADMVRVQFGFETLFRERGSYAEAAVGCGQVGTLVSSCSLGSYLPTIAQLRDPGHSAYRVERVPDGDDYAVGFTLERSYDGLGPGKHVVTRLGIR